jgi:hypothetical protein
VNRQVGVDAAVFGALILIVISKTNANIVPTYRIQYYTNDYFPICKLFRQPGSCRIPLLGVVVSDRDISFRVLARRSRTIGNSVEWSIRGRGGAGRVRE